jgi:hypothetical protein
MELHTLDTSDSCQRIFFPSITTANILAYEIQNTYEETVHLSNKAKARSVTADMAGLGLTELIVILIWLWFFFFSPIYDWVCVLIVQWC